MASITIWAVVRWLHLLSIITWFGGLIFILLVVIPLVRAMPGLAAVNRTLILLQVGKRYQPIAWLMIAIGAITGYYNGERRNVSWLHLTETVYGRRLHMKLEYAGVVLILMLIHAYWINRRLARIAEQELTAGGADPMLAQQRRKWERISFGFLILNIILTALVVLLASSLIA